MKHVPSVVLHKTTLIIWSREDPRSRGVFLGNELELLKDMQARDDAYVSKAHSYPMNPHEVANDSDWDENEFFDDKETLSAEKK